MAGMCDMPYRLMHRRWAAVSCTEMISAMGLKYGDATP